MSARQTPHTLFSFEPNPVQVITESEAIDAMREVGLDPTELQPGIYDRIISVSFAENLLIFRRQDGKALVVKRERFDDARSEEETHTARRKAMQKILDFIVH
jgi:hypothetical protein